MTGQRLSAALTLLEASGGVKVITPPTGGKGGRPSPLLRLHPQALDLLDASGGSL